MRILSGLISIDGDPAPLCWQECELGDDRLCGRPANHPADEWGHMCPQCVEAGS
jgi:hypothetical protein